MFVGFGGCGGLVVGELYVYVLVWCCLFLDV